MRNKLLILFIITGFNFSFAQLTDSLALSGNYDFAFFRKYKVKKIKRYKEYYTKGKRHYRYLEYTIYIDKKLKRMVERYNNHYKMYYAEGKNGTKLFCGETLWEQCDTMMMPDSKNEIHDGTHYLKYDSLGRAVLQVDTANYNKHTYMKYLWSYENHRLSSQITQWFNGDTLYQSIIRTYNYISPLQVEHTDLMPASWKRAPVTERYIISPDRKKLEILNYEGEHLILKYIDVIVTK